MNWTDGPINGVVVRPLKRYTDHRGWLAELVRDDELPDGHRPAMAYVSVTHPGISRGPHEHREQADCFGFVGPGNFRVFMWDARPESPTQGQRMRLTAGESNPAIIRIPAGVVHAYVNRSTQDAWVLNFPDRLFAGPGRREPVDEIRHEDRTDNLYKLDDEGADT